MRRGAHYGRHSKVAVWRERVPAGQQDNKALEKAPRRAATPCLPHSGTSHKSFYGMTMGHPTLNVKDA